MTPRDGRWSAARRVKNDAIYGLVALVVRALLLVPRRWLPTFGWVLGIVAYALVPRARRTTIKNLARVNPDWPPARCRHEARRVYLAMGACLTDTVAMLDPDESADRTLDLDAHSAAALELALAQKRGVVFITCHLGPWERMAALLSGRGYPISTVARESYDRRFHRLLYDGLREKRGVSVIYRGAEGAPYAVVRALRAGRVVGFLVDLPGRVATVDVELLGCRARLALGPLRIALRTNAVVVVGTPAPGCGGRLRVRIEPVCTDDLARGDEMKLAERIALALSERIGALPTHWPWMHPSFTDVSSVTDNAHIGERRAHAGA